MANPLPRPGPSSTLRPSQILSEARAKANALLSDARTEADSILAAAKAEVDEVTCRHILKINGSHNKITPLSPSPYNSPIRAAALAIARPLP